MEINNELITYLAQLSSLKIEEAERGQMLKDLESILEFVSKLSAVETKGVEPTAHCHNLENEFRDDFVKTSLRTEKLRALTPHFSPAGFRVPKVIS